jgi:hypothetical protein
MSYARELGVAAREKGAGLPTNPFSMCREPAAFRAWERGWLLQDQKIKKATA